MLDERLIGSTILVALLILAVCGGAAMITANTPEETHGRTRIVAIAIMVVLTLAQGARILAN